MENESGCCSENVQAPVSMIMVQFFTMGMFLLSKLVLSNGAFVLSLLTYRNIIGALCIAPLAYFFERDMMRNITAQACGWIFVSALLGIPMSLGFYYYGLKDTTAAYSSNFLNLIPVVTYILGIVFRMERLALGSRAGKLKVFGTLLCVGGTLFMCLYKGEELHILPANLHIHQIATTTTTKHNWVRGTIFLLGSLFSYAFWFITQAKLFRVYPSKYCATMLTCVAGCFQTTAIGLIVNRSADAWVLKWDLQLATIVYSGLLNTGATFCLILWVIPLRGPTYPPMFNSISVILTTIFESMLMGQKITVGSISGMCMIIFGLYAFLYGKRNETQHPKLRVGDIMRDPETGDLGSNFISTPDREDKSPHLVT